MSNRNRKYCFLQFQYEFETLPNEEVYVVGNVEELGNWDISKAEKLVTGKLTYPVWKSKENIKVFQNSVIEYKYIFYKNGIFSHWESQTENRKITIQDNMLRLVVSDPGGVIKKCTMSIVEDNDNNNYNSDSGGGNFWEEQENTFLFTDDNNNINDKVDNEQENKREMNYKMLINEQYSTPSFLMKRYQNDIFLKEKSKEMNEIVDNLEYSSGEDLDEYNENASNSKAHLETIESEIDENDEIFMCMLYLPLDAIKNEQGDWELVLTDEPIYHTLYKIMKDNKKIKWFGLLKNYLKIPSEAQKEKLANELETKYNMYVIKLPEYNYHNLIYLLQNYVEPLFHYVSVNREIAKEYKEFNTWWEVYINFNKLVADTLLSFLGINSIVFLNDYHLLLVPSMLRAQNKKYSIGLYMHSAFPSYEIFKRIPRREEVLKSIMLCSVVGFHSFDCSRNFLATIKRILSVNYQSTIKGDLAISYEGNNLIIRVHNVTPEPSVIEEDINKEEFTKLYTDITKRYINNFIYVCIDSMQFLFLIKHKLEGYRRYLRDIGDKYWQNILLQYIRISSANVNSDGKLCLTETQKSFIEQIETLAEEINREFKTEVVKIIIKKISYTERLAIFASGNCLLRSSKKESFSMSIYEFLLVKMLIGEKREISYMLSELSGANTSLGGTIKINPFDCGSYQRGFLKAFQPHFDKIKASITQKKDFIHVKKSSAKQWFDSFCKEIKNAKINNQRKHFFSHTSQKQIILLSPNEIKPIEKYKILHDYQESKRRLIFLDFEGTLPQASSNLPPKPSAKLVENLINLVEDKRNLVFIVSESENKELLNAFGNINGLVIASNNGFLFTYKQSNDENKWNKISPNFSSTLIDYCGEIMKPYTQRCEGSFIETKETSKIWNYKDCDMELGKYMSKALTNALEYQLSEKDLKVNNGKGYVEVIAKKANKGAFISYILKSLVKKNFSFEFILACGDGDNDEEMFTYLKKKKTNIEKTTNNEIKIYTIKVGKIPSNAEYFVDNEKNVLELLEELNSDFKKGQYEKNSSGMNIDYIFGCGSFTTKEMSFKSALGGGE